MKEIKSNNKSTKIENERKVYIAIWIAFMNTVNMKEVVIVIVRNSRIQNNNAVTTTNR